MTNNPAPQLSPQLAPAISSAILAGAPLPPFEATMTLDEAYGVQHDVLGLRAPEGLAGPFREDRLIECEVALRVDGEGRPIACVPALELVSLNSSRETDMNAINLLAVNSGAEFIALGEFLH